jgi:UDP-N-acetylmuramoyl-tripeptide--D-alanyl-D-alanine ligase
LHAELGHFARRRGVDLMFTCGLLSSEAARAFGTGGHHFASREALLERLPALLRSGDTVLVKGSRAAAMELVVASLCGEGRAC